ncbi:MAG: hypothetical protein AAFU65_07040, partial [Pseudomonadota bacterium]
MARVDGEPSTAVVPFSFRVRRVDRKITTQMWLHHGLEGEDGDLGYSAPQLRRDEADFAGFTCDGLSGFYFLTVSSAGDVTGVDVWPESLS